MEQLRTSAGDEKWAGSLALIAVLAVIVVWVSALTGFMGDDAEVRGASRYRSNTIELDVPAGWATIKVDVELTESVTNRFRDPQQRSNVLTVDTRNGVRSAVVRAQNLGNELGDAVQFGPTYEQRGDRDTWYITYIDEAEDDEKTLVVFKTGDCLVDVTVGGPNAWAVAWMAVDSLTNITCPV